VWSFSAPLKRERTSFDSTAADCDVRELVNPARCERVPDGIETRTSPKPRESAGVDGGLSSRVEIGSKPIRGASGSQAMVAGRLPTPEDSVRFVGDPLKG